MTADLSKELWYHGRVSRMDAECILDQKGNIEGSYLVRDSMSTTGEYVLSLCHQVINQQGFAQRSATGGGGGGGGGGEKGENFC